MPSIEKLLHFQSSALLSAIGVALLGYGMSTDWAKSTLDCSPMTLDNFNGSSTLEIGLFNGTEDKISCPRFDKTGIPVEVFKRLAKMGGAPIALHGLVIALLAFALLGSACSILVTLYNSFSNPYETYMGPIGLYTCSGFSACAAFLALILFVLNVFAVQMFQTLVLADDDQAKLRHKKTDLQVGFYLLIPYIIIKLLSILVVYLYVHAAFTRRKQQEKPTEDAPMDIMLF